jgi:uncharacterized protein (DUF2236 family)
MRKKWKWFFIIPVFVALFLFIGGEIVMHLWNWLVPALFGWRTITFWQAVGLLALCRILFGGWHGGQRSRFRQRMRERMTERMEHMTPEEREEFQRRWRARCGFGAHVEANEK